MHTDQLFELVYILLEKKKVTAGEMARHFGVSARTVYRWVEALSMADVPVYAEKGKGGGIRISENYAIDKAVLTEREKLDVLAGIRTLSTLSLENASGSGGKNDGTENSSIQSAITKIQSLFRTSAEKTDWIQVDFAPWNPKGAEVRTLFAQLKNAILSQRQIRFDYFSSAGKCGRVLSSRRNLSSADRRGTCTVCTVRMNRKILRIKKSLWRIKKTGCVFSS